MKTPASHTFSKQHKQTTAEVARRLRSYIQKPVDLTPDADPIATLVATILSQNTSDINSHRAYLQLRATYPTWDEVADADETELAEVIRSGGLAEQKSRTIVNALGELRKRSGAIELPGLDEASDDELLKQLTSLKGIGLKTAACVLMFSLGRDVCAVDTHVYRVVNRLGIVAASTPDKTFHELRTLIPRGKARQFHVDLIRFGRTVCKAQRPHCYECPLVDLCRWEERTAYLDESRPGPSPASGDLMLIDIVREHAGGAANHT